MNDELYHHGIKGMKWGKRRFQNPDGTLTAAGKNRAKHAETDKQSKTLKEKWNGLTDKQKLAVKLGTAATATALAAYGTYKVSKFAGKRAADKYFVKNGGLHIYRQRGATLANRNLVAGKANLHGQKVTNTIAGVGLLAVGATSAALNSVAISEYRKNSKKAILNE